MASYTEIIADGTVLGEVPGIRVGTFFRNRQELHEKKLHRGLMRGIAPHGSSIVLSGGYVDDEDMGEVITYTGEGGRDPIHLSNFSRSARSTAAVRPASLLGSFEAFCQDLLADPF